MKGDSTPTEMALSRLSAQRRAAFDKATVVVTILGDGKDTKGYEKRMEVKNHLDELKGVIEVNVPELLYGENEEIEVEDVELAAIHTAHVVICLAPPDKHPLGMYTEVERYFKLDEASKWFWVYPDSRPEPRSDGSMVAALAQRMVECMEPFEYRDSHWRQCNRIRAACKRRVLRAVALEGERELVGQRGAKNRVREG